MLGQILGDLVAAMLGDAVMGTLFPGWSEPEPRPEEGEWNASMGTVAAFLALVAAMFGGLASFAIIAGIYDAVMSGFLVLSLLTALAAGALAHRTFRVTKRRHALARVALWLSRATVTVAVGAVALSALGITFGSR